MFIVGMRVERIEGWVVFVVRLRDFKQICEQAISAKTYSE
jgi:hypothetical protein